MSTVAQIFRIAANWIAPLVLVVILAGCPFRPPGPGLPSYSLEVTGLRFVDAKADSLNDEDDAAGAASSNLGNISPVVWRDGALVFVQHAFQFGLLHGINNNGAVVGTELFNAPGSFFPLVTFVGAEAPPSNIDFSGQLYSLNDFNQYVGAGVQAVLGMALGGPPSFFEAEDSALTNAYDINELGDFAGSGVTSELTRAVKWEDAAEVALDSFGGPFSEAYAINNHGVVVGVSTNPPPAAKTTEPHLAVYWVGSAIPALPTLGGTESTAWDINDHGEAVGFSMNESDQPRAVVWRNVGVGTAMLIDLNDVTDFSGVEGVWVLLDAIDINEIGTILCEAEQTIGETTETVYVLLRR